MNGAVRTLQRPRLQLRQAIVLGTVAALTAYTALITVLPDLRFALLSPDLRIALEVAELCVALFTALALLLAESGELGPARNALVAALVAMAAANAIFGIGGLDFVDADVEVVGRAVFYPWLAGQYVAGGLLLAALAKPDRLRSWHYPALTVGGFGVGTGAALAFGARLPLPLVVFPDVSGGWAIRLALPFEDLIIAVVPGVMFAGGAWLAWRVSARTGAALYLWITLALVSQSFSKVHELLYMTTMGPLVTSIDVLRALMLVGLLVGALHKVRDVIIDRRAAVEGQAADLRARENLLTTMREFTEREEVFRSVVVHELATPIATMGAFAHALDRHADQEGWSPQARTAVAGIHNESRRLQQLVARMDELRRLELSEFSCDLRPLPLRPLIEDAGRYVQGLPGSHPAIIECATGIHALADPVRVGQALRDMLANAATYSPEGAPILIACEPCPGRCVRIRVEDDGPGVPVEERQRVLRMFERGAQSANDEGSGLGLYVARRIADAHGGGLHLAEPRRLCGACVVLELRQP